MQTAHVRRLLVGVVLAVIPLIGWFGWQSRVSPPVGAVSEAVPAASSASPEADALVERPGQPGSAASRAGRDTNRGNAPKMTYEESLAQGGTTIADGRAKIMASLARVALSEDEARWLDANGMPRRDVAERYMRLPVDRLAELASHGDVGAAVLGAKKASAIASGALTEDDAQTLMQGSSEQQMEVFRKLTSTDEWNRMREMLWDGVTYGSAYAASQMAMVYRNPLTYTCMQPGQCDAWELIAWRMGDWSVIPSADTDASLAMSLDLANRFWSQINARRAMLGLAPLEFDLRPNQERWRALQDDPHQPVNLYPR